MGGGDEIASVASDGCTGFWWAERLWSVRSCCVAHDSGGSDLDLFMCWVSNQMPLWVAVPAIALMLLGRPLYELVKPAIRPWLIKRFGRKNDK